MGKIFRVILYCFITFFSILIVFAPFLNRRASLNAWFLPIPSISGFLGFTISVLDIMLFSSSLVGICVMLIIISKKYYVQRGKKSVN